MTQSRPGGLPPGRPRLWWARLPHDTMLGCQIGLSSSRGSVMPGGEPRRPGVAGLLRAPELDQHMARAKRCGEVGRASLGRIRGIVNGGEVVAVLAVDPLPGLPDIARSRAMKVDAGRLCCRIDRVGATVEELAVGGVNS